MDNEGKILDLVLCGAGKTAAELTHDLRTIGNGDMAEGIAQIADFAARSGFNTGEHFGVKKGLCYGLLLASAGLAINQLYKWHIHKVEEDAAMWQRVEDQSRAADKEHWAEFEALKEKVAQMESEEEGEEVAP